MDKFFKMKDWIYEHCHNDRDYAIALLKCGWDEEEVLEELEANVIAEDPEYTLKYALAVLGRI